MNQNNELIDSIKGEVNYQDPIDSAKRAKIEIPAFLIDIVNKALQEKLLTSLPKKLKEESAEGLWKIIIRPEFHQGLRDGSFSMSEGTLEIRNAITGRYVGKAQLDNTHIQEIAKNNNIGSLSDVFGSIANISGQMQLAEISKKLDILNEKIDSLGEFLWREKMSELQAVKSTIEEARESLPNPYAFTRINESISKLQTLSNFFRLTIEKLLHDEEIVYSLSGSFIEGLKFWELRSENKHEYNKQYTDDIAEFINKYNYLIEMYFQTLGLIGTCYQLTDEHHHSLKYFTAITNEVEIYSEDFTDRLIYLLNINETNIESKVDSDIILQQLEDRKIPDSIKNEIRNNNKNVKEINDMHERLSTQLDKVEITYDIDPNLLLGGTTID